MKEFKKFEITNLDLIKAGVNEVTWVGSDGNGNSLMDIVDTDTGDTYCSVNDYDLDYNVGDTFGAAGGGATGTSTASVASRR